jgi:thioredoxin 1
VAYSLAISACKTKRMNTVITNKEFKKEVLEGKQLSIVQFKTDWNGACEIIAPIYEDLARSYKHVAKFFTIDADKEKAVTNQFRINETPVILFFKNGNVIDNAIGVISRNTLISKIETALSQTKQ